MIDKPIIDFKNISCPICNCNDYRVLFTDRNRRENLPFVSAYVKCKKCTMIYLNPIPNQEQFKILYKEIFEEANVQSSNRFLIKVLRRLSYIFDKTYRVHYLPYGRSAGAKILDIGCGDGVKLRNFKERGYDVFGVDVNPLGIEIAKNSIGGHFFLGTLEEIKFDDEYFDVIRMDNVLEHIENPKNFLMEVKRILKTGGKLIIYVPNGESFSMKLLKKYSLSAWIPFHINLFSRNSIQQLLTNCEFQNRIKVKYNTPAGWLVLSMMQLIRRNYKLDMHNSIGKSIASFFMSPISLLLNLSHFGEELIVTSEKSMKNKFMEAK